MLPADFLAEICAPAVAELSATPTSRRLAWCASVSLFHYLDFLVAARAKAQNVAPRKLLQTTRSQIEGAFPRFQVLADIANASKHFQIDRKGPRTGLSVADMKVGPSAAFTDGTDFDDGTSFSDMPDCIRVEFNGEIIDVPQLCADCLVSLQTIKV